MKKSFIQSVLAISLAFNLAGIANATPNDNIVLENKVTAAEDIVIEEDLVVKVYNRIVDIPPNLTPFRINNTIYFPFMPVAQAFGVTNIEWDKNRNIVTYRKGNKDYSFSIDKERAKVKGEDLFVPNHFFTFNTHFSVYLYKYGNDILTYRHTPKPDFQKDQWDFFGLLDRDQNYSFGGYLSNGDNPVNPYAQFQFLDIPPSHSLTAEWAIDNGIINEELEARYRHSNGWSLQPNAIISEDEVWKLLLRLFPDAGLYDDIFKEKGYYGVADYHKIPVSKNKTKSMSWGSIARIITASLGIQLNEQQSVNFLHEKGLLDRSFIASEKGSRLNTIQLLRNLYNHSYHTRFQGLGDHTPTNQVIYTQKKKSNDSTRKIVGLPQTAEPEVKIKINGKIQEFSTYSFIYEGTTMVPIRGIFEALNATVTWDPATQRITAKKEGREISLKIMSDVATINGQVIKVSKPAIIKAGRTVVPARIVSAALGAEVEWDGTTGTVSITTN